jgi:hypothetical protein
MPFLKDEDIRRLTGFRGHAEYELDLTGLDLLHSKASIDRMLERSRFRAPRSVVIRIDKAGPNTGETHFQPIGRMLVEALRAGTVLRCRPLPEPGGGFWIRLKGNPSANETEDIGSGDDAS